MTIRAWAEIPDLQVEEFRPVTASLMRRLRDNLEATRRTAFRNPFNSVGGGSTSASWTVVDSLHLVVDPVYRGPLGQHVGLWAKVQSLSSSAVGGMRMRGHGEISGTWTSNEIDLAGTGPVSDWLVIYQNQFVTELHVRLDLEIQSLNMGINIIGEWESDAPAYMRQAWAL